MSEQLTSTALPPSLRLLLRLEGLTALAVSGTLYARTSAHGLGLFLGLFLVPDLSLLAYLRNPRTGAVAYNLAHTYLLPVLLTGIGYFWAGTLSVAIGLIWTAHIGFDRFIGYGLKYPTSFQMTHLGAIGQARA